MVAGMVAVGIIIKSHQIKSVRRSPSVTEAVFPFGDSAERFGEWQHRFGRAIVGLAWIEFK